jgi:hypothetical protein
MNIIQKFKEFFTPSKVKELEEKVLQLEQIIPVLSKGTDLVEEIEKIKVEKIISKILYNTNTKNIDIILSNGNVLSGIVEKDVYEKIRNCNDELMILNLISPIKEGKENGSDFDIEVEKTITPLINILSSNSNFEIEGDKVYLKGIKSISIPSSIVGEFIRLHSEINYYKYQSLYSTPVKEYKEEFDALLMFTFWLLLNPIESSRNDCLDFVKKNDIQLTSNGLLICYRKVVSKGSKNKELIKFISENYFKKKKQKKSAKNYSIYSKLGDFMLCKNNKLPKEDNPYWENIGNLHELYQNLHTLKENTYTDNHTKTKTIKVGSIYKEDEDKIDLDNTRDCSSGLHVGSKQFMFDSFGDTGVIALINPMFVRSVPVSDAHKMRVSEMFLATIADKEEFDNLNELIDFSTEYCSSTLEDLQMELSNKVFEKLSCQDNLPITSLKEIIDITKVLSERIVKV